MYERAISVKNKRMSDDEFWEEREKVLNLWPTGKEVDLDEAVEYHKNIPAHKTSVQKIRRAREQGKVLTQCRGGICLIDEYIKKLKAFQDEGKVDIVITQGDSYTRNAKYDLAEQALKESEKVGRSLINGCPYASWGIKGCRRLFEAIDLPMDVRSGDILSYEIGLASGATAGLFYFLSQLVYHPRVQPEILLQRHQLLSRLVGYYEEHGVSIFASILPFWSASFHVGSLEIAQIVIDALLMAEQGVRNIGIKFVYNFHLIQDIAKGKAVEAVAKEYFDRFNYESVDLFLYCEAWQSSFPRDPAQASALIALGATIAHFSGACMTMVKSTDEGIGLPTTEAQVFGLRLAKQVLNMLRHQEFPFCQEVEDEKRMLVEEAKLIIEKVLELGEGDLAAGAVRAVYAGVIDNPFSSSQYNTGKVLPVRDAHGAVRYLETGNLPFTEEIREFHRQKVAERKKVEKIERDSILLQKDILAFVKDLSEEDNC